MPINEDQLRKMLDLNISTTFRSTSEGAEDFFMHPIECLDHGFVRLCNYMGTDSDIVRSARVSYGRGTKTPSDDKSLIRYLIRNRHTTPLESCVIQLHMKLPIFVARQLIRHRTAGVNEYSARYSILDKEFYIPETKDLAIQSSSNRQGRGEVLSEKQAQDIQAMLHESCERQYAEYEYFLNDDKSSTHDTTRDGLARELARIGLTLNFYTQWYWKIDLHNLFHFLKLRKDKHAQYEIRVFADAIGEITKAWCPMAYEAWEDCVFNAHTLTKQQWEAVKAYLPSHKPTKEWAARYGIQGREYDEFLTHWN